MAGFVSSAKPVHDSISSRQAYCGYFAEIAYSFGLAPALYVTQSNLVRGRYFADEGGARHLRYHARDGSLWADGGVFADEWDCAAGE